MKLAGARIARALALVALPSVLSASCLEAAEERAEADREVGRISAGGADFEVVDGLAAVRGMAGGELVLWASAPAFRVRAKLPSGAPAVFGVTVQNVMPDAELRAGDGVQIAAEPLAGEPVTRKRWRVELPGGTSELVVAPPDAELVDPWRFALLSDVQEAIDGLQDIHRKLNQQPNLRFLLGAGDLTQRGQRDELERYQAELETLQIPYYSTLGNHELGQTPTLWHEFFGRGNFKFVYRGVQFTMLDSASSTIDPSVYEWLDAWLEEGRDRVHIVAMHIPPVDPIGVRNGSFASRPEAAKLLTRLANGGVDLTLYGHIHSYYEFDNAAIPAYISGGGGAVPERFDGIGRHFLVVEVGAATGVRGVEVVRVD
jgi:3',5'-cyclic-AMP phosphodiesterase